MSGPAETPAQTAAPVRVASTASDEPSSGRVLIKLCGVRTAKDAALCAAAGADEVGVIFAPGSKRRIELDEAHEVKRALSGVPLVAVFKDATLDELDRVARELLPAALQLHGALPEGLTPRVRDVPVYVALHVSDGEALLRLAELHFAERILLDGPGGGGSGTSFAWALAQEARKRTRAQIFVAGGLTPENVGQAIRSARPDGVDVASGIEGADGFKDEGRVRAFVQAVRAAGRPEASETP